MYCYTLLSCYEQINDDDDDDDDDDDVLLSGDDVQSREPMK